MLQRLAVTNPKNDKMDPLDVNPTLAIFLLTRFPVNKAKAGPDSIHKMLDNSENFSPEYKSFKPIKHTFLSIPIIALTATLPSKHLC